MHRFHVWHASVLLAVALLAPLPASAQAQWSMGYWADDSWSPVSSIEWAGVTHISHWTIQPNTDGTIQYRCQSALCSQASFTPFANTLISAAHANGVKVLLSIRPDGDWNSATSSGTLATFVSNLVSAVNTFGYDGIDLDWEISINTTQYINLGTALRTALGSKLLTVASAESAWASHYTVLDRINTQTYDAVTGCPSWTWFNSALNQDDTTHCFPTASIFGKVKILTDLGVPISKINIGLPFYGYIYSGATAPRQSPTGTSFNQINYRNIVANYSAGLISGATIDPVSQSPWFPSGSTYVTFDNAASLTTKINYAKAQNLGGWFIWQLAADDLAAQTPRHPLLHAVALATVGSQPTISSFTATPATIAPGGSSSLAWVESGGTTCSISGIGTVPCSPSSRVVTPAATTTYTLTVTNPAGSVTRQATVTLNAVVVPNPTQAAIVSSISSACNGTAAGTVLFPNGTYPITSTINLPSNCRLQGQNNRLAILSADPSIGLWILSFGTSSTNQTVDGLVFNGGYVRAPSGGSSHTRNFTFTNNSIQNIAGTHTCCGGMLQIGVLDGGTISNNTFFHAWYGGWPSSPPANIGPDGFGPHGILITALQNATISSNLFDGIGMNAMYLGLSSDQTILGNNTISYNEMKNIHRAGFETQTWMPNTVFKGNYYHDPYVPTFWAAPFSLPLDQLPNLKVINNTSVFQSSAITQCPGNLPMVFELDGSPWQVQGNVSATIHGPISFCVGGSLQNMWSGFTYGRAANTSDVDTFRNNIWCGDPRILTFGNYPNPPVLDRQYEYTNGNSCPAGSNLNASSINLASTSANNQNFPSGGNGTWSDSVVSNLSIRYVQYFIDGSSTAAVTQEIQDVNTNFANDRQWLYHATISTTGMAAGAHTITAVATDVAGATQSVMQGFTVGSLVRSRGPEPSLPFARIPAGHAECEFGMILDTLLSNWNQNCLTTEIKNVNTYLTAGKSTSQSFTLFPQSVLQQYNVKLTQNGVSGQSGIVGFGGDDIGANLGDPGFRSYVFDTYIPTILMPHAPNQTPVYVSIDNYLNPGRSWFGVTTNGSWSNAGVTWDPPFSQTDPAWNLLVAGWYQYATIHAPNIRLDPHLGSMAVSDWAAFPTLFQYTPSLMREWFNISGLHGYSASVRQQNYLGLYWFEQFGNHFAPVFPADGTTRTFHWGVQPDNGDYHSAFANYLMVRGPNTFFDIIETVNGLATGVDPNRWLPIAKTLGTATSDIINAVVAPGHVAGDGYSLMERTWTNGIAYNNMTGLTQTVTLPAGSLAWVCTATPPCTFTPVSSLTLPDGIGDVILLSAPTGVPVINSFTANPAQVNIGSSSTLSWSTTGATSLTLNPGNINVTGLTSSVVTPSSATTYTLTATSSVGSVQRTVTVTIRVPASYFVSSSTGVDTNPGTQAAPWKTISKASAGPAGGYIPADSVLLKAGDTWCQTGGTCAFPATFTANFTTPSSGTSGNPITYGTYGTGAAPILDGSGGFGVVISRNFITWNGIQIKNIAGTGILFSNTTGTQIRNVVATNVNNWAFKGYQVGTSTLDGNTCTSTSGFVQLSGCVIAQVNGATPQTQTITATHNTCHFDFLNTTSSGGNVICVEVGGPVATNSSIVGNLSFGGTQFGGFKPGSCTGAGTADVCFGQVTGGLIADNEIHKAIFFGTPGSTTLVGDGETIELQGAATAIQTGVIVTRNVIYGQQSVGGVTGGTNVAGNTNDLIGLFQAQGNSIYGNVLVCPCGNEYAIQFETNAGGNSVFNNTIIQAPLNLAISNIPTQMAIRIGTDSNETIKNNIISGFGQGITGNSSNISDYNLFDSTVTSPVVGGILAGTNSLIGPTPASVFATTPTVLQNDVKLIAGSPAASAGLNLGVAFSQILDPSGAVVPYSIFTQTTSWEMGAFGTTLLAPARTIINGAVISGAVIQ